MKLDVDALQGILDLYRSAMDNHIPVAHDIQGYLRANRAQMLDGFKKAATSQILLLRAFTAENDEERAHLDEARRIVRDFQDWVGAELAKASR